MAEMLVFTFDKEHPDDIVKHHQLPKRGHVVAIHEDGAPWGREELKNPPFQVVKVPGVKVSDLSAFVQQEYEDEEHPYKLIQYRGYRFDLDKHDGKSLTLDEALKLKVALPVVHNPDVLK